MGYFLLPSYANREACPPPIALRSATFGYAINTDLPRWPARETCKQRYRRSCPLLSWASSCAWTRPRQPERVRSASPGLSPCTTGTGSKIGSTGKNLRPGPESRNGFKSLPHYHGVHVVSRSRTVRLRVPAFVKNTRLRPQPRSHIA